ncbi:MAG: AmmeMemoRadiSam system radical SAM enzyme [Candidatus Gastranaerophilales bacterium]|nr:AmmeMemoRadiSam system radical SAM enzyme [Candidatus Gastranaerophilales bacterium]
MKYFEKQNNKNQCLICPRKCRLSEGQRGLCSAIINQGGELVFESYGFASGFAIDPVEKKPLYHFYPTSKALSFGTFGCNMGCRFCQNHHISKHKFDMTRAVAATPEQVVQTAINYGCKSIAFTYNDPIVFMDYAVETAKIAHANNVKTIAVTAGYILPEARKEFFSVMDGANIDLKAFTPDFYKKLCLADINYVLDTIKYVANETDCTLELTTLLIEEQNNSDDELKREFEWIANNLGTDIPLHLSAFHPDYKLLDKPRTSEQTLLKACNLAKDFGLNYVYCGNILNERMSLTSCPKCGYKLIERNGYNVNVTGLQQGKCGNCGHVIYGRF